MSAAGRCRIAGGRPRAGARPGPSPRTMRSCRPGQVDSASGASRFNMSLDTRPRETQFRRSAHTSIGGSTTSALSSATATLRATISPKSRSSGSDDVAMTATPDTAVSADTMNAAPGARRGDVHRVAWFEAAPPFLDEAQQDQRRELGARRDDERAADRGHRAQLQATARTRTTTPRRPRSAPGRATAARESTLRSRTERNKNTKRIARYVRRTRLAFEVVEQPDADDGEPRRCCAVRPRVDSRST